METAEDTPTTDRPGRVRGGFWLLVSLAGVTAALTLLFLGMRAVMAVGGTCASGGPYVIGNPCPKGIPLIMVGSIWGGLIFAGIYIWQSVKAKVPSFAGFLWPALFLSLGWNFFEFAFRANNDGQGVAWGWIVCGVLFFLMGGIPLVVAVQMLTGRRPHRPSSITGIANSIKMAETGISAFRELRKSLPDVMSAMARSASMWRPTTPGTPGNPTASAGTGAVWPGVTGGPAPTGEGLVAVLAKLDELHRSGALSDDEYQSAKRQVLGGQPS